MTSSTIIRVHITSHCYKTQRTHTISQNPSDISSKQSPHSTTPYTKLNIPSSKEPSETTTNMSAKYENTHLNKLAQDAERDLNSEAAKRGHTGSDSSTPSCHDLPLPHHPFPHQPPTNPHQPPTNPPQQFPPASTNPPPQSSPAPQSNTAPAHPTTAESQSPKVEALIQRRVSCTRLETTRMEV